MKGCNEKLCMYVFYFELFFSHFLRYYVNIFRLVLWHNFIKKELKTKYETVDLKGSDCNYYCKVTRTKCHPNKMSCKNIWFQQSKWCLKKKGRNWKELFFFQYSRGSTMALTSASGISTGIPSSSGALLFLNFVMIYFYWDDCMIFVTYFQQDCCLQFNFVLLVFY